MYQVKKQSPLEVKKAKFLRKSLFYHIFWVLYYY
jgi:hypothetical protein